MNVVDNKTMKGDHMIMLAVLSGASILMLYYGSLMTPTEVYLPITATTLRHSRPEVTTLAPKLRPEPKVTTLAPKLRADANICCQAETPICKACHEGISVEEYLKKQLTTSKKLSCVEKHIDRYIDLISTAAKYNIRIFPRNGFLLGIARHKGYLPNEKIDADLGMIESDFKDVIMHGKFGTYTLQLNKIHPRWAKSWNGIHPITGRKLPPCVKVFLNKKKWTDIYLFYDFDADTLFYPVWAANFNLNGNIKENIRWSTQGSSFVYKTDYSMYNKFNKSSFVSMVPFDFYNKKIMIPSGYENILIGFYGKNWMITEKRLHGWKSIVHDIPHEPLKICSKDLNHFSWKDCKMLKPNESRTEVLYNQLRKLLKVINNTDYIVGYGTLLGIIRDKNMNPNEVDNDILIPKTFKPTQLLRKQLFDQNLILFKSNIYRLCEYTQITHKNIPPWKAKTHIPYTDLYNELPIIQLDRKGLITKKWTSRTIKFRDIYVKVPDNETIYHWMKIKYKNWKKSVVTGWKKRVIKGTVN